MLSPNQKPFLQEIKDSIFVEADLEIYLLRLDLIHPGISGNKWYKLKYNLEEALLKDHDAILTFGGTYSNHIHATATAANRAGLKSIGVIRGERTERLNPTLKDATGQGMILQYVSRTQYRNKYEDGFISELRNRYGDFYIVPEGGSNPLAIKGASEILNEISIDYEYILTAAGTGGTMAGLVSGLKGDKNAVGISVLKGDFLKKEVEKLVFDYTGQHYNNWGIINDYHFGGYAKYTDELISFINTFKRDQDVPLDPVYTGKMMYALYDLAEKGYFRQGSRIIVTHTGGLQGIRGFNERFGKLIR